MKTRKPLTKFDVSVSSRDGKWIVIVRSKVDSEHATYDETETRWLELTRDLPTFRG